MTGGPQEQGGEKAPDRGALLRPLAAGILALVVAMGIGRFAYTPILPAMQGAFGLGDQATGALASSNHLGYLAGAVSVAVVAPAGARQGAALRASLAAVAVATGSMALTTSFAAWAALRFLAGVASAAAFVLASGLVLGALAGPGRSDLSGWLYGGVGAGIAVSGLVVFASNALPGGTLDDWRAGWAGCAAVAALLVALCWVWLPESDGGAAAGPSRVPSTGGNRVRPVIALLCAAYFLEGLGYIVSGTFLVRIVEGTPGLAGLGTGAWVLVGLAAAPSTVLWARAASRAGHAAALVAAYAAQAVGIVLPALSGSAWAAAGSALLFGGTFMGITALTLTFAGRQAPRRAARTVGTLTAAFGLGQVVGPLLAAALAGGPAGFGPSLVAASAAVLLGGLLVLAAAGSARRRERERTTQTG